MHHQETASGADLLHKFCGRMDAEVPSTVIIVQGDMLQLNCKHC